MLWGGFDAGRLASPDPGFCVHGTPWCCLFSFSFSEFGCLPRLHKDSQNTKTASPQPIFTMSSSGLGKLVLFGELCCHRPSCDGKALSGPKHRGRSHRAPWGSGASRGVGRGLWSEDDVVLKRTRNMIQPYTRRIKGASNEF